MKNFHLQKDSFFKDFKDSINAFSNLSKDDRVIVSVSGGLDSITLLLLLHYLDYFQLIVAHINHKLRCDSDSDEKFVKDLCVELKVPFYCTSLEPEKRDNKYSIEEWARLERYSFLNQILEREKCHWIMTGHHANDQAETILMNLSRKSGVAGLRGIAKKRNNILRPMLDFTKKEIRDFEDRIGFAYREDITNLDKTIPRNFLRQKILRPWENELPEVIDGISQSAKYFIEWRDGLDFLISNFIISDIKTKNDKVEIPINILRSLPRIVGIRLIQLLSLSGNDQWSKHTMLMLNQFIDKSIIGDFHILENGWRILHDRTMIKMQKDSIVINKESVEIHLDIPVLYNDYKYLLNLGNKEIKDSRKNNFEIVDWSKLKDSQLEIRLWQEGDIFQPLGMDGHQKLSDFLINEKIDRMEKESQSVLTADGEIVWVCGKRLSNWARITKKTTQVAVLSRNLVTK